MAKRVGFGKLEREMLSNERLPPDLRVALIDFKNRVKAGHGLTPYDNRDGGLPMAVARELPVAPGRIDVLGVDVEGQMTLCECK